MTKLLGVLLLAVAGSAVAAPTERDCAAYANFVAYIAAARDQGTPLRTAQSITRYGDEKALIARIYSWRGTPGQLARREHAACMSRRGPM